MLKSIATATAAIACAAATMAAGQVAAAEVQIAATGPVVDQDAGGHAGVLVLCRVGRGARLPVYKADAPRKARRIPTRP